MVGIDDRPEEASDRRFPVAWEGDLVVCKGGKSTFVTMVEKHGRFLGLAGLARR